MMRERDVLDLLHLRYGEEFGNGRRYVVAEHVKDTAGHGTARIADCIAMDVWPSSGLPFHGHEVKVSRADWLCELRDPSKAEAFRRYMDRWWLVVSDRAIVKPGELPVGWGLMAVAGSVLRVVTPAPVLNPEPMARPMLASLMRAVAKTATRRAVTS